MEYIVTRINPEDELAHHGVLGMRWGHRKAKSSTTASSGGEKKKDSTRV